MKILIHHLIMPTPSYDVTANFEKTDDMTSEIA